MHKILQLATRGSELALWQTKLIQEKLKSSGRESELNILTTKGDVDQRPFQNLSGDGFFTKELERSMLLGRSDMAVHSAKDLPSMIHEDLPWVSIGSREESGDVLIARIESGIRSFESAESVMTNGFKIGSSSPRRLYQIKNQWPHVEVVSLRGNVPTRVKKVVTGEMDAVVLAKAGLKRLGILNGLNGMGLVAIDLPFVAAPCQGIIGLQHIKELTSEVAKISDPLLTSVAKAEKQILAFLGGGCHLPLGAQFEATGSGFTLNVFFQEKSGTFEGRFEGSTLPLALRKFFHAFVEPRGTSRVWLSQPLQHSLKPARLLSAAGKVPVIWPLLEVVPCWNAKDVQFVEQNKDTFGAVSFSSQFAVQLFLNEVGSIFDVVPWLNQKDVFAVGASTAKKLEAVGVKNVLMGSKAHGRSLADKIQSKKVKGKLLIPGQKTSTVTKHLRDMTGQIHPLPLYRVRPSQSELTQSPPIVQNGDQIVITSPSAAREFVLWCQKRTELKKLQVWAFGPSTSKELTFLGVPHKTTPESGSWEALISVL